MLGAIIGDIAGSRWEFNPTNDYNFEFFSDLNDYTDDSICTVAVADALLHGSDNYGAYLHTWCRKHPYPMGGYGGRFAQWVRSNAPTPYGSFGNGSAMRVSPIGWWFDTPEQIAANARLSAECTHNHAEGLRGAEAVALAIAGCRALRHEAPDAVPTADDILLKGLRQAVELYCNRAEDFSLDIEDYRNRFDETCQGTVPVALWIVQHSKGFEDALRTAVSLGADADTLGAIVGSMAEALWGIPDWMRTRALAYLPDDMKAVVDEFYQLLHLPRQ